ncbi:inositol 2-dehydrogenase [uncultured Litoreibacter sp.]|uniref:inositol 2-dehydrogenase n=1 Tax=uncultured Litoreibacter sp. TaxID=1392394 RepID=UPI00261B0920|nr:inositol 2-dehydrogenase [uncultured Litoreibacter sp.]
MLSFGILGCGRIGQVHARAIMASPDARVAAVSDFLPAAAETLAVKTEAAVMTSDEIIADTSIDAVIIGTPTTTHYDLIHQAAAAGKAIFCEKPIDLSAERIRECLKAVETAGVPFMVAFNRRFDPNFASMQARIEAGEVGDVELVTILSRDPSAPPIDYIKTSGGIFRDMMIHDLDMARFLLGEDPVSVHATGSCLVDPAIGEAGDFDTAAVTLRTASGKICQINNSRRATYGYDQRIEVHGSKGMIRADNILESSVEVATETGYRRAPPMNFFLERYEAAYANELAHFVAALTQGKAPLPNGLDGLKAQMLADAAAQSCADGLVKSLSL